MNNGQIAWMGLLAWIMTTKSVNRRPTLAVLRKQGGPKRARQNTIRTSSANIAEERGGYKYHSSCGRYLYKSCCKTLFGIT